MSEYKLTEIDFNPFEEEKHIIKTVLTNEPQKEIWLSCVLGGDDASLAYNESISLSLEGNFHVGHFEEAILEVIDRHEALRATISGNGETLFIYKHLPFNISHTDLTEVSDYLLTLETFISEQMLEPFDLQNGPLLRIFLHKITENHYYFTLVTHHIICDGWSLGVIMEDLSRIYNSKVKHLIFSAEPAPQISMYSKEMLDYQQTSEYESVTDYWLKIYSSNVPVLDLPTDYQRPAVRTYNAKRLDYSLPMELVDQLKKLGAQSGCSLVNTLLSAFEIFLFLKTNQRDIVIGLPSAGQAATGNLGLVGHCVNLLPLKSTINPKSSLKEYLKTRKTAFLDAQENQKFTFGELIKKLSIKRDNSRIPLVPVVFNIDLGMDTNVYFEDLSYKLISNPRAFETFEIFLNATGSKSSFTLEWSYNTQLFKDESIHRMASEFEQLLYLISANPETTIEALSRKNINEWIAKLKTWNNTDQLYPSDQSLVSLIDGIAVQYPEKIAVTFGNASLSYKELISYSNQFANHLSEAGVQPTDIIGIAADRSIEMLVALLAILKSGATYLPLDPEYPQERIEYMLAETSAKMLLVSKIYSKKFRSTAIELTIEDIWDNLQHQSSETPQVKVKGKDLAYILYTSGSTGKPKGVEIRHHNLLNFLTSMQKEPGISAKDRLLAITTISFDIAGLELYLPLITGAELIICDRDSARDGRLLLEMIEQHNVTIMQATPSTWRMILESGWIKRYDLKVLCGGEALSKNLAASLLDRCTALWNMYGPTETTIWSTIKQIAKDEDITIGYPIQNTQIYILDEDYQLIAPGNIGEICIGGEGLAAGYFNQPLLSAERFFKNSFSNKEGDRLYKTGDLGMFLENGEIVCLGRIDQQVKIRGHRIELGEIESELIQQHGIKQAVVVAREDTPGNKSLVGYVTLLDERIKDIIPSWKERWDTIYDMAAVSVRDQNLTDQKVDVNLLENWRGSGDLSHQAEEWLKVSIDRIRSLKSKHIYEIGSGAGQILFEIAPNALSYLATDYAEIAIDKLKEKLAAEPGKWKHVKAKASPADDFTGIPAASFDLILVHSVAQYFPDTTYFLKVIEESVKRIKDGGCLFIGDMQGKNSLEMYHSMDQLPNTKDHTSLAEFKEIVDNRVKIEDEFTADPGFFYLLKASIPSITGIDVQLRRGTRLNETVKYHYDIWIYINSTHKSEKPALSLSWDEIKSLTTLEELLRSNETKIFEVKNVLNKRTAKDFALYRWVKKEEATNMETIKNRLASIEEGLDPELFWNLGAELDYQTHVRWSTDGTDGNFDVVFIPSHLDQILPECPSGESLLNQKLTDFARNPQNASQIRIPKTITDDWTANLKQHLPDYMVPVDYVVLKSFPLTPNNKIDKNALPKPQIKSNPVLQTDLKKLSRYEQITLNIWQNVLEMDDIGLEDDFFELGGHSLLAVKVMTAIEKETGKRLPLAVLFENSTITKLAKKIESNEEEKLGALVPIKPNGTKDPIYLIHGAGLNILLFKFISGYLDDEQPVYGLQAAGLSKPSPLLYTIEEIAALYISEMIESNPEGPYCLTGYSSGGTIAFEMARQLIAMGRKVKFVGIVDCYAGNNENFASTRSVLARKIVRQFKKFPFVIKSFIKYPYETFSYQLNYVKYKLHFLKPNNFEGINEQLSQKEKEIYKSYNIAHRNYRLVPADIKVSLFSVNKRLYYIDDPIHLGWKKFAKKGVDVMNIPGDHITMLAHPNDMEFARILQETLNKI